MLRNMAVSYSGFQLRGDVNFASIFDDIFSHYSLAKRAIRCTSGHHTMPLAKMFQTLIVYKPIFAGFRGV